MQSAGEMHSQSSLLDVPDVVKLIIDYLEHTFVVWLNLTRREYVSGVWWSCVEYLHILELFNSFPSNTSAKSLCDAILNNGKAIRSISLGPRSGDLRLFTPNAYYQAYQSLRESLISPLVTTLAPNLVAFNCVLIPEFEADLEQFMAALNPKILEKLTIFVGGESRVSRFSFENLVSRRFDRLRHLLVPFSSSRFESEMELLANNFDCLESIGIILLPEDINQAQFDVLSVALQAHRKTIKKVSIYAHSDAFPLLNYVVGAKLVEDAMASGDWAVLADRFSDRLGVPLKAAFVLSRLHNTGVPIWVHHFFKVMSLYRIDGLIKLIMDKLPSPQSASDFCLVMNTSNSSDTCIYLLDTLGDWLSLKDPQVDWSTPENRNILARLTRYVDSIRPEDLRSPNVDRNSFNFWRMPGPLASKGYPALCKCMTALRSCISASLSLISSLRSCRLLLLLQNPEFGSFAAREILAHCHIPTICGVGHDIKEEFFNAFGPCIFDDQSLRQQIFAELFSSLTGARYNTMVFLIQLNRQPLRVVEECVSPCLDGFIDRLITDKLMYREDAWASILFRNNTWLTRFLELLPPEEVNVFLRMIPRNNGQCSPMQMDNQLALWKWAFSKVDSPFSIKLIAEQFAQARLIPASIFRLAYLPLRPNLAADLGFEKLALPLEEIRTIISEPLASLR